MKQKNIEIKSNKNGNSKKGKNDKKLFLIGTIFISILLGVMLFVYLNKDKVVFYNTMIAKTISPDELNEYNELKNNLKFDLTKRITIGDYKIIGNISIEKIGISYPILEKYSDATLNLSICKFWGTGVNEIGNLVLSGHNNKHGTLFSKLDKLDINDIIEITDMNNNMILYKIVEKYEVKKQELSVLDIKYPNTKELTLITCDLPSADAPNRIIIKAIESKV